MQTLIGNINSKLPIHIIGAGASGLILGYFLKKKGYKVTIYEKEKRVGGLIETIKTENGLIEKAANAIFTNDDVIDLLKELQVPYVKASENIRRRIVREKKFLNFPFYWYELPRILLGFLFKKAPIQSPITLKDFLSPCLGEKICDEVVSTGLLGIYASSAENLEKSILFTHQNKQMSYLQWFKAFAKERAKMRTKYKTKASISFAGGMQDFINALQAELKDNIIYQNIDHLPENCIVCTNATAAAALLLDQHPIIAHQLKQLKYSAITTATFFTKEEYKPLKNSFGVLFSRRSAIKSFGILANHEVFPHRSNQCYAYTFIKEKKNDDLTQLNQDQKYLAFPATFAQQLTSWEKGIPTYNLERYAIMKEVRTYFSKNNIQNLALFGNYVDGISLREMISMAKNFEPRS